MTSTGIDGLESTIHKTNEWLNDIMEEEGWTDKNKAYLALRSTLHALRDRLVVNEAIDLGAQLPCLFEAYTTKDTRHRASRTDHKKRVIFSLSSGGISKGLLISMQKRQPAVYFPFSAKRYPKEKSTISRACCPRKSKSSGTNPSSMRRLIGESSQQR